MLDGYASKGPLIMSLDNDDFFTFIDKNEFKLLSDKAHII